MNLEPDMFDTFDWCYITAGSGYLTISHAIFISSPKEPVIFGDAAFEIVEELSEENKNCNVPFIF